MTELRDYFQALAIKKVLKECISSLEIKKVLPPLKGQMPVDLFNWNCGLDERKPTSMIQHRILLKKVSLKSLEQQKTAMDYQQLILLLKKLLLGFNEDKQIADVLEIFDAAKKSLETIESLKRKSMGLQHHRSTELRDEVGTFEFQNKKPTQISLEDSFHPMAAFIEPDVRAKYYKHIHTDIDDKFEMERIKVRNQIDNLVLLIRKEEFCGEEIAMTYKGQAYNYSYRIEKLTEKFDEDRTNIEEEIDAKLSEIKRIRQMTSRLYTKMLFYRQKIQEHLKKYPSTISISSWINYPSDMGVTEGFETREKSETDTTVQRSEIQESA